MRNQRTASSYPASHSPSRAIRFSEIQQNRRLPRPSTRPAFRPSTHPVRPPPQFRPVRQTVRAPPSFRTFSPSTVPSSANLRPATAYNASPLVSVRATPPYQAPTTARPRQSNTYRQQAPSPRYAQPSPRQYEVRTTTTERPIPTLQQPIITTTQQPFQVQQMRPTPQIEQPVFNQPEAPLERRPVVPLSTNAAERDFTMDPVDLSSEEDSDESGDDSFDFSSEELGNFNRPRDFSNRLRNNDIGSSDIDDNDDDSSSAENVNRFNRRALAFRGARRSSASQSAKFSCSVIILTAVLSLVAIL